MTRNKSFFCIIAACIAFLLLTLDAKTALYGASEAVWLCLSTIIPSLFPFFVVSIYMTSFLTGKNIPFLHPLGKLLQLPKNTESILLIGFLGGYPVGAQCIAQAYTSGAISRKNAERMLAFCSNAGPAFLFGIGTNILKNTRMCWLLWLIHIFSALIVGFITPSEKTQVSMRLSSHYISISDAMNKSIRVLASVCGWIVLFRTMMAFFSRWFLWMLPDTTAVLFSGLLELANGCTNLGEISSIGLRFQIFTVILAFGGMCVMLQTSSVIYGSGLSIRSYFSGKVTQAAISYILCVLVMPLLPEEMQCAPNWTLILISFIICVSFRIYFLKTRNQYSIPVSADV